MRYLMCSPKDCVEGLSIYTVSSVHDRSTFSISANGIQKTQYFVFNSRNNPSSPLTIVLNTTQHIYFNGTNLERRQNGFDEWTDSQAVANIVVACTLFESYDNVSAFMHDNGFSYTQYGKVSSPAIVYHRYNRASKLVAAAAGLGENTFTNIFDDLVESTKDETKTKPILLGH